jgi:hypothetical protein
MRKFGKTIITFAAAMFAAFSLTACQGGSSKTSIDVSSLADDLNAKTIKSDTLTETSSDMLSTIYFFENGQVSESKAFMSSGATADEICVVKCVDENAAKAVTEYNHLADVFQVLIIQLAADVVTRLIHFKISVHRKPPYRNFSSPRISRWAG